MEKGEGQWKKKTGGKKRAEGNRIAAVAEEFSSLRRNV
jgi:hypothetical protein